MTKREHTVTELEAAGAVGSPFLESSSPMPVRETQEQAQDQAAQGYNLQNKGVVAEKRTEHFLS